MTLPNTTNTPRDAKRARETKEAREKLMRLAEAQGATLATSFDELLGSGGDDTDETADDIIRAVREWRNTPSHRRLG